MSRTRQATSVSGVLKFGEEVAVLEDGEATVEADGHGIRQAYDAEPTVKGVAYDGLRSDENDGEDDDEDEGARRVSDGMVGWWKWGDTDRPHPDRAL